MPTLDSLLSAQDRAAPDAAPLRVIPESFATLATNLRALRDARNGRSLSALQEAMIERTLPDAHRGLIAACDLMTRMSNGESFPRIATVVSALRDLANAGTPEQINEAQDSIIFAYESWCNALHDDAKREAERTAQAVETARKAEESSVLPRHSSAAIYPSDVAWSAPEKDDETRTRSATVAGFAMRVWREESGCWRWGATDGIEMVPSYHSAPTPVLAKRDAEAWARAHGVNATTPLSRPLAHNWRHPDAHRAPMTVRAMVAGDVRRFLADPAGCGFMVAPPESSIRAAQDIMAKRRARVEAIEAAHRAKES